MNLLTGASHLALAKSMYYRPSRPETGQRLGRQQTLHEQDRQSE